MRRPLLAIATVILIGIPAALLLAGRQIPARVLAKQEIIEVNDKSGAWHHRFVVRVTAPKSSADAAATRDTFTVAVPQYQYDAARFGSYIALGYTVFAPRLAWLRDTTSQTATLLAFIKARRTITHAPLAVSPLDAQTAGLARVVHIHRVRLKPSSGKNGDARWIQLVEVEFWAQRVRGLVRTIDVIDAGSIPGLAPRAIIEMHYDQREPRVMRLDDGHHSRESGN